MQSVRWVRCHRFWLYPSNFSDHKVSSSHIFPDSKALFVPAFQLKCRVFFVPLVEMSGSFSKVLPSPDAPHEPDPGKADDDDAANDDQNTLVQFTTAIYFVEESETQWHWQFWYPRARNTETFYRFLICPFQQDYSWKNGTPMITDAQEKFLTIDLMRLGSMKGTITVNYYTEDGSAKAGLHYESIAGEVPWAVPWAGAFRHHQDKSMALPDFSEKISWLCYVKVDGTKLFLLFSPWRTCHVNNLHSEDPELISWAFLFLWLLIIRRSQILICQIGLNGKWHMSEKQVETYWNPVPSENWQQSIRMANPPSPSRPLFQVTFKDDEFRQSIRVSTIASPYWSPTLAPRWIWWSAGEVLVVGSQWLFLCPAGDDGDEFTVIYIYICIYIYI